MARALPKPCAGPLVSLSFAPRLPAGRVTGTSVQNSASFAFLCFSRVPVYGSEVVASFSSHRGLLEGKRLYTAHRRNFPPDALTTCITLAFVPRWPGSPRQTAPHAHVYVMGPAGLSFLSPSVISCLICYLSSTSSHTKFYSATKCCIRLRKTLQLMK